MTPHFRLQLAERSLADHAQKKRSGSGHKAVRLIETERQRLGRDLHTGVGQMLAAIRLQVEIISRQLPDPPVSVRQAMEHIDALANDALEQVRSISKRLHPPEWQRLTLEAALQQLWEISGVPQGFESTLRISPLPAEPDLDVKVLLYRAAQEALSNLAQHSQATRVVAALFSPKQRPEKAPPANFTATGWFSRSMTTVSGSMSQACCLRPPVWHLA